MDLDAITIVNQEEETLYCSLPIDVQDEKSTLFHLGKFFSESIYFKSLGAISAWMRFFKNITIISTVFSAQLIRITPTESV